MERHKAKILEVFPSLQGEGLYVGERQVFVRFWGCNLDCVFCDTVKGALPIEMDSDGLLNRIERYDTKHKIFHSVSLTGGEPLLQFQFLKEFLPSLRKKFIVYLETNGSMPNSLNEIIDLVDIISADIKLPSSAGGFPLWDLHRDFLKVAKKKEVFVKIVLTKQTKKRDLNFAMAVIEQVDKNIPLVLQPVTPNNRFDKMNMNEIMGFYAFAKSRLENVKLIPQMHVARHLR